MKKLIAMCALSAVILLCTLMVSETTAVYAVTDFSDVEKTLGISGKMEEGAYIVRFGRTDISVTINGEPVPTSFGFGGWTAWKSMGKDTMVMGDLVLLDQEINPVISALAEANIDVTGLHNHFLWEQPRIMYMHIHGMGEMKALAQGVRNALDKTGTPLGHPAAPPTAPPPLTLDTKRIEQIVGHPGQEGGGVFKITVGRKGVKDHGVAVTSSMGLNSWVAFVGTNERAHVAGDAAMTAGEVNKVIRALRRRGVDIVAVHNHMVDEKPRIFFLHYWGTGKAENLAQAFREALDQLTELK